MSGTAPSAEPSAVVSVPCGAAFRPLYAFSRLPCVVSQRPAVVWPIPSAVVSVLCGAAFRPLCAFSRFPCVVSRLPDGPVSAVLTLVRAACPPVAAHRRHFAFRCFGWRSLSFGFAGKKPMSAHNVPRNLSGCLCGGTKPCENLLPPVRAGRMCQASVPDKRN